MAIEYDVYAQVVRDLRARIPHVAAQVEDEVLRGRTVLGSELSRDDRAGRSASLRGADLQALASSDIAAVPFDADERLKLLCLALVSLAESMYESRRALLRLATEAGVESRRVIFMQPDDDSAEPINLSIEALEASTALDIVRELLQPLEEGVF